MKLQMRQQNLHQLRFSWKWGRACQGTCSSTQANACWYPAPCNWSIASEYWYWYEIDVNDVASHCSVVDHAQSPGVVADVLRVGMERSAIKLSRSEFEIYTFSTKHDQSESAADELLVVSHVSSTLALLDTCNVLYRLRKFVLLAGRI